MRQEFIMDLALELGFKTVESLRREMTESELGQWFAYARKKLLPTRRIEYYLANLARLAAGGDKPIDGFLLFKDLPTVKDEPLTGEQAAKAISGIVGGAQIVQLGQRKRAINGN